VDAVTGALIAAGVAWLSIWLVIAFPPARRVRVDRRVVRGAGAATIGLFGLEVLGLGIPLWVPLAVLGGGLVLAVVIAPRGYAAAA
jgi:hypothetical protein